MSLNLLAVTNAPVYLAGDNAASPFGEVLPTTATAAAPAVFTTPGYNATLNDAIVLGPDTEAGTGAIPTGFTAGVTYFVVSPSGDTYSLSLTKGGSGVTASVAGGTFSAHISDADVGVQDIALPFKSGNTVLVFNFSGGSLVLQGAMDTNTNGQAEPGGPGSFTTILTLSGTGSGCIGSAQLNADWIRVSTAATLYLVQV